MMKTTETDPAKLVRIRQFLDSSQALIAKGILNSAGIDCFLGDENTIRMDWFWSFALGGIKLMVQHKDVAAAKELLDQNIPENFFVEGVGEYEQPRCPVCGSFDVSLDELRKGVAVASIWLAGIPLQIKRRGWKCHSCEHVWEAEITPQ